MSEAIRAGKAVHFTYSIVDEASGRVLEQSDMPMGYVHGGYSTLIAALERALEGRQSGDKVQVRLPPEQGFGPHDPALTFTDDIANVPEEFRFVGAEVEMQNEQGEGRLFIVSEIKDGRLTVDGNHPFAGKTLVFHVTVQGVRSATEEEKRGGHPADAPPPSLAH